MPRGIPRNKDVSAANRLDTDFDAEQADAEQASDETTTGTPVEFVKALISKNTHSSTVIEVPEWELDILREIHGNEGVKVLSVREVNYPHVAWMAFQYLRNKYKTREDEDTIKRIYPRLRDFAKSTGLPYTVGDDAKAQVQASSVIFHENTNTAVAKSADTKQGAAGSGTGGSAGG